MKPYEQWVVKNLDKVSAIESAVRMATFFLPASRGTVENAVSKEQLTSEILYSVFGLLGSYHDFIAAKALQKHPAAATAPVHIPARDMIPLANFLTFVSSIQLPLEMFATYKYGTKKNGRPFAQSYAQNRLPSFIII